MATVELKNTYWVTLTEQTIRELLSAIEESKHDKKVVPDQVVVGSKYSNVTFTINLEEESHQQESLGYKIISIKERDNNIFRYKL